MYCTPIFLEYTKRESTWIDGADENPSRKKYLKGLAAATAAAFDFPNESIPLEEEEEYSFFFPVQVMVLVVVYRLRMVDNTTPIDVGRGVNLFSFTFLLLPPPRWCSPTSSAVQVLCILFKTILLILILLRRILQPHYKSLNESVENCENYGDGGGRSISPWMPLVFLLFFFNLSCKCRQLKRSW